jgi:hypothetical protein
MFKGDGLMFIGYGVQIHMEGTHGWGLKTTVAIKADTAITQYEVRHCHVTFKFI